MQKYTDAEIATRLESFQGWEYVENALHTSFEFDNFKDAFAAMTRISFEVEKLNHHPEWTNVYRSLEIFLSTHDAGGVTEKDFQLAKIIDDLLA